MPEKASLVPISLTRVPKIPLLFYIQYVFSTPSEACARLLLIISSPNQLGHCLEVNPAVN